MSMNIEAMMEGDPEKLNDFFRDKKLGAPYVAPVGCLKGGVPVTYRDVIESTRERLEQAGRVGVTDRVIIDGLVKLANEDQLRDPEVVMHHRAAATPAA